MSEQRFFPYSHNLERLFASQWPMVTNRYQRDYAWEAEEVEEFIDDLRRLALRRGTDKSYSHFFGAIVAVKHDREDYERSKFEIVDGQQRLATFSLFESALIRGAQHLVARLAGENRETAESFVAERKRHYVAQKEHNKAKVKDEMRRLFTVVERDNEVFTNLMDGVPTNTESYSHELLVRAAARLYDDLVRPYAEDADASQGLVALITFSRAVEEGSEFIFIHTKSEQHATQLFSVLNDRGRRLEESDLLRAHTLMLVSAGDNEDPDEVAEFQDRIASAWDSIDVVPRKTVDAFLRHHFASVTGTRVPTTAILKQYRRRFFGDHEEPVVPEQRADVVTVVESFAASMVLYEPISRGAWPFAEKEGALATPKWDRDRLYRLVRTLRSERILPLLLSAAFRGRGFMASIITGLERVEFRAIVAGIENNRMANLYFDVAALVRSGAFTMDRALDEVEAWVSVWATDDLVASGLRARLVYGAGTNYIKHFLTTLDDHRGWLAAGAQNDPKPGKLQPWDMGQVEDEHIFPRNPDDGLPEGMDRFVNRLGNQAFWGPEDNKRKEASNRLPTDPVKIKAYRAAQPELTRDVGKQLTAAAVWGPKEIETREQELVDAGIKVYRPRGSIEDIAAELPPSRSSVFTWREPGDSRVWLASSKPESDYEDVDGESYEYPAKIPNGQQIAAGDTIILFRPKQPGSKAGGLEALPARIFGFAFIDKVVFNEKRRRQAVYEVGSYRFVDPAIAIDVPSGGEPRSNQRNAINQVSVEYLAELVGLMAAALNP